MVDHESAVRFYNQAVSAVADKTNPNHLQIAYSLFSSACMADPTWGQAFYQSGNNHSDMALVPAAIASWRRALDCEMPDQDRAKILVNLGWRLHSMGQTQASYEASHQAIDLDPTLSLAYLNLSLVYGIMGQPSTSVEYARKAFDLDQTIENEIALAFALLFDGQYQEGFRRFEKRFAWRLHNYLQFPYPKWEGESALTVYLSADQGLGDTLSFARFVEATCKKSKYVHAAIQPELMRLFMHAFSHIPNLNLIPQPCPFPQADAWTTFVSLPYNLGLTDQQVVDAPGISQLALPGNWLPSGPVLPVNWKVPGRKLHIGFAWAGSPLCDVDKHRNIPVEQFFDLYRCPGIQLYSIQCGPRAKEVVETGGTALIRDLSSYICDIVATLALMRELDLVITIDSAPGHIAGAAGKETWLLQSDQGRDYRVGHLGEKSLWYPKHRVFRQGPDQQWGPVFDRLVEELRERTK